MIQHRTVCIWHECLLSKPNKGKRMCPVAIATERRRLQEALAANVALTFSRSAVGVY
jgi:hypothetical protein